MRLSYSYSSIKNREKRLYSISGTTVSTTGVTSSFIKILALNEIIFNIIGIIICLSLNNNFYLPITESGDINITFSVIFIGIPFIISSALYNIKVQHYRLIEFIIAYLKPKRHMNDQRKNLKQTNYSVDSLVERVI